MTTSTYVERLANLLDPERNVFLNGTAEDAAAYEAFVEETIEPFNEVGLFDPPAPNMYPHTAAPVTP